MNAGSWSSTSQPLIPNFPDDLSIQILARVPCAHHPSLSLVCKSWHSTLHSPPYFTTRSQLNCIETFLCINFRIHSSSFKWVSLPTNPNPSIPKHPKPKPLPSIPTQAIGSAFAVLGSKIFVIGGSINEVPCRDVWVFDARVGRWEEGVKMRVGREFAAAGIVNGKIYVIGGCLVDNWTRSTNWAEAFDPKTGVWAAVSSPVEIRDKWMHASAVVGGKMYAMADRGGVCFDPEDSSWGCVGTELDLGWRGRAAVVDEILYCYDYLGKIRGFDGKECVWRDLKGLENELPKFLCGATMANVGGKLCVVWEGQGTGRQIKISCAVIEVRRDCFGELWGSIVWMHVIMEIPRGSSIVHCLAVEF